jgi:hypothetical protein
MRRNPPVHAHACPGDAWQEEAGCQPARGWQQGAQARGWKAAGGGEPPGAACAAASDDFLNEGEAVGGRGGLLLIAAKVIANGKAIQDCKAYERAIYAVKTRSAKDLNRSA